MLLLLCAIVASQCTNLEIKIDWTSFAEKTRLVGTNPRHSAEWMVTTSKALKRRESNKWVQELGLLERPQDR